MSKVNPYDLGSIAADDLRRKADPNGWRLDALREQLKTQARRIAALEAQAARDAALRDLVMGEVHYWEVRVEYWEGKIERSRGVDKDIAIGGLAFACERRDTLRAALAAREVSDYRAARGCLPMAPDAEPSEVVIRRFRGG